MESVPVETEHASMQDKSTQQKETKSNKEWATGPRPDSNKGSLVAMSSGYEYGAARPRALGLVLSDLGGMTSKKEEGFEARYQCDVLRRLQLGELCLSVSLSGVGITTPHPPLIIIPTSPPPLLRRLSAPKSSKSAATPLRRRTSASIPGRVYFHDSLLASTPMSTPTPEESETGACSGDEGEERREDGGVHVRARLSLRRRGAGAEDVFALGGGRVGVGRRCREGVGRREKENERRTQTHKILQSRAAAFRPRTAIFKFPAASYAVKRAFCSRSTPSGRQLRIRTGDGHGRGLDLKTRSATKGIGVRSQNPGARTRRGWRWMLRTPVSQRRKETTRNASKSVPVRDGLDSEELNSCVGEASAVEAGGCLVVVENEA
ncbi:hypothetical protein C8R45DRAFT_928393 [Mycena sanguinolenta]|nr:hypothetical protein C8R45DRAFT_928393 [Mycena sanguinolenta]